MRIEEDEEEGGEEWEGAEVGLAGALTVYEQLLRLLVDLEERMRNQELPSPLPPPLSLQQPTRWTQFSSSVAQNNLLYRTSRPPHVPVRSTSFLKPSSSSFNFRLLKLVEPSDTQSRAICTSVTHRSLSSC